MGKKKEDRGGQAEDSLKPVTPENSKDSSESTIHWEIWGTGEGTAEIYFEHKLDQVPVILRLGEGKTGLQQLGRSVSGNW